MYRSPAIDLVACPDCDLLQLAVSPASGLPCRMRSLQVRFAQVGAQVALAKLDDYAHVWDEWTTSA